MISRLEFCDKREVHATRTGVIGSPEVKCATPVVTVMSDRSSGPGPRGKVSRLIEQDGLDGTGDYLVERWTAGDGESRMGLRALAREFNRRLLEARLAAADVDPIEGTAESYYEALAGEEASSGVRTEVRRRLERAGLDVGALEADFVSRQAVHTYLTSTRGVTREPEPSVSPESVRGTLERLRERVRNVTAGRLGRLRDAGALALGDARVVVSVEVYCTDCGTQRSLSDLLAAGGCDCEG